MALLTNDMIPAPSMVTPKAKATLPFDALRMLSLKLKSELRKDGGHQLKGPTCYLLGLILQEFMSKELDQTGVEQNTRGNCIENTCNYTGRDALWTVRSSDA